MVKYENLKLKIDKVSIELNISTFHVVDYLLSLKLDKNIFQNVKRYASKNRKSQSKRRNKILNIYKLLMIMFNKILYLKLNKF